MWPLTKLAASEARKMQAPCRSSTLPQRPAGVRFSSQAEKVGVGDEAGIPGLADLEVEKQVLAPQIKIHVNYAAAAQYGVPAPQILSVLQSLVEGEKVTQIVEGNRRFALVVRLPETARSLDGLGQTG